MSNTRTRHDTDKGTIIKKKKKQEPAGFMNDIWESGRDLQEA